MIRRLGHLFARLFRATTPDPFVLAIGLTLVVFALAMAVQGAGPLEVLEAWQGPAGFFGLLGFAMQMVLILVTGHALASAPLVERALGAVARLPRTGAQAAALVAAVAIVTSLLNWGLGLVCGAILARDVGRSCAARGVPAHYPLLCAAGYTGLLCWHGGLSGTAPLMMTTTANVQKFLGEELGGAVGVVPFTETIFGPLNLTATGGLLVLVPILCALLAPGEARLCTPAPVAELDAAASRDAAAAGEADGAAETIPDRVERSPLLVVAVALPLGAAFVAWAWEQGLGRLDPDALNLLFLTLGLALHGSLRRYVRAATAAVRGSAGIVLQFPFYAGILGVLRGTGLGATFASALTELSGPKAYALLTFLSAGVVNLFVPSGGGQWAIQGPIAVEASRTLGVSLPTAIMSVAYGDQLTNMLQPFWALPLLAITGVKARDIIGYTAVVMIAAGAWLAACLLALG